jgi:cystathionine beta-lyase
VKPSTRLVTSGRDASPDPGFVNPPLVRGSTVLHGSVQDLHGRAARAAAGGRPVGYGRAGTPTHDAFLDAITTLEGGFRSAVVPSGLAACTTAILAFAKSGDHVLVTDSAYGPTRHFCSATLARFGVEASFFDPRAGEGVAALFRPNTRLLYLESPGSLTFEVHDTPLLARIARERGAASVLDNTWATPLLHRPLALGIDCSIQAVTKYIGGHSDLLLGTITATEAAWPQVRSVVRALGLTASPDDCWLALRGLRSLAARLERHRACADALIAWLQEQPEVAEVLFPALPTDPGHALWKRDFTGASGLFGFRIRASVPLAAVHAMIDGMTLFGLGYSWGGFESLLIPVHPTRERGPPDDGRLLRISAGLEDPGDLIDDLHAGFERLRANARKAPA